jgi:predicted dehydrogenase
VSTRWRVVLIGAGRVVERVHLPILGAIPGVEVVALHDPDAGRAAAVGRAHGISGLCETLDDLLATPADVALVASPNAFHAPMASAALEAGLHVLCEKPMATSGVEARALAQTARRSGRELMVGFPSRFRPEVAALKRSLEGGELGELRSVRCGWLRQRGVPGAGTWFTERRLSGGGALIDLGSHLIDLVQWFAGPRPLQSASCRLERLEADGSDASWYAVGSAPPAGPIDVEAEASGFLVFAGPLDVFIEASWARPVAEDHTYFHVIGRRGSARIDTLFGLSPHGVRSAFPLRLFVDGRATACDVAGVRDVLQPYRSLWEYFLGSLEAGRSLRAWLAESVAGVEALEALYQAAGVDAILGGVA